MQIEFSKHGEGAVLITAVGNTLYLDKPLGDDLNLNDEVPMGYDNFERLVELNFYKTESIDNLIEKLKLIRANIILASAS